MWPSIAGGHFALLLRRKAEANTFFAQGIIMLRSVSYALFLIACLSTGVLAEAPQFPSTWVNSKGLSAQGLKGKVVVLYYYEEDCPRCRGKWPGLKAVSEKYKGKPVVFIAVNSGNDSSAVTSYMKAVDVNWPVIVDQDRSFERKSGVGTISLQNIYQAKIIAPDGSFQVASPANLDSTIQRYLPNAKWRIDPATVPASLKAAWAALEQGQYAAALPPVQRSLKSSDEKTKAAAQKMYDSIVEDLTRRLAEAKKAEEAGHTWTAFNAYQSIANDFKTHPKAKEARSAVSKLRRDKKVKRELIAAGALANIQKMAASTSKRNRQQAKAGLAELVSKFGDTEAGQAAASMRLP
jgi:thiol-disulfide isomerase/thioredoxin